MENVEDYCIIKKVFHLLGPNLGKKKAVKITLCNLIL